MLVLGEPYCEEAPRASPHSTASVPMMTYEACPDHVREIGKGHALITPFAVGFVGQCCHLSPRITVVGVVSRGRAASLHHMGLVLAVSWRCKAERLEGLQTRSSW